MKTAHLLAAVAALSLATGAQAYTISLTTPVPGSQPNGFAPFVTGDNPSAFVNTSFTTSDGVQWLLTDSAVLAAGTFLPGFASAPDATNNAFVASYGGVTALLPEAVTSFSFVWETPAPGGSNDWNDVLALGSTVIDSSSIIGLDAASAATGALVTISGLAPFTEATFTSEYFSGGQPHNQYSFEFYGTKFGSDPTAAPEASTWAMMLLGFAGLGYAGLRQRRVARLASI